MTEVEGACTFAERIGAMIDWAEVVIDGVGTVHVTVSAGCAEGTDIGACCSAATGAVRRQEVRPQRRPHRLTRDRAHSRSHSRFPCHDRPGDGGSNYSSSP
ncbi:MAG TPA: hypothetical protein VEZ46_03600 [Mycobacteriales bacterium]|nr:hypothetical protein [Mycobacteriales bacterium]